MPQPETHGVTATEIPVQEVRQNRVDALAGAISAVELRRYARFLQMLALKPDSLTSGSFGAAMAEAEVSEGRVQKLLSARGPALSKQLRLIARRLANAGKLPYRQIGDLLLVEDEDGEYAEAVRLRIARDYWRALDRADVGPVSPEA